MRLFQIIVLFLGLAISSLSLWHDVNLMAGLQSGDSFCSINETFDCDAVTRSDYSVLFGVPIAAYAFFYYLTLFLFSIYFRLSSDSKNYDWPSVTFFWSIIGAAASFRLAYISIRVLETYCLYCMGLYIVSFLFILSALIGIWNFGILYAFASGCRLTFSFCTFGFLPRNEALRGNPRTKLGVFALLGLLLFAYQSPLYILRISYPSARFENQTTIEESIAQWENAEVQNVEVSHASVTERRDFFHGSEYAPVTIVAFSDFECPFCRELSFVLRDISDKYPDDVKVVFKHFPLDHKCNPLISGPFHEFACQAAAMAICAGVQMEERFWVMHDLIYSIDHLTQSELLNLPSQANVSRPAFVSCLKSKNVEQKILNDINQGQSVGVQGTPAVFLNSKRVEKLSFQVIDAIINKILSEKKGSDPLGE